ncbi:MAG: 4-hydroxy-tetrahydrodipicolinate synthase [Bryobacteraceae bacterium]
MDVEAFERLIESQIAGGVSGVVPIGTTGESPTLSAVERHQVIELAVGVARKRCAVIVGTGSNSTRDAIAHTQEAEKLGADGALLVAPYYNKPSQDGLFQHFAAIAEATALPLVLYNIPGRCAIDIAADTVVKLAERCANIVAIKEASGSVDRVSELGRRLPNDFSILSGDDSLTLAFLAVGAVGVVSVVSNLFPAEISQLVRLFLEGKAAEARQVHQKFYALFKDLFIEPNPVPVKTALAWRGAMEPTVRLPLTAMSAANEERLRKTLQEIEASR